MIRLVKRIEMIEGQGIEAVLCNKEGSRLYRLLLYFKFLSLARLGGSIDHGLPHSSYVLALRAFSVASTGHYAWCEHVSSTLTVMS